MHWAALRCGRLLQLLLQLLLEQLPQQQLQQLLQQQPQQSLQQQQQTHQRQQQCSHQLAGGPGSFTPPGSAYDGNSLMEGGRFFIPQQQQQQQARLMQASLYNMSPDLDNASSVGGGEGMGSGNGSNSANGSPGPFEAGLVGMNNVGNMYTGGRRPSLSLSMPGNVWTAQQQQQLQSMMM